VSNSRPRINPRRRALDSDRLAAAILDLAAVVELDDDDLAIGAEIYDRVADPKEKSA
jgi:hypothetical protein